MIRLVPAELALLDAAVAGDEALAEMLGYPVAPGWITFTDALAPTRDSVAAGGDPRWGTRFFVTEEPVELVGWGGFKGPPADGVAEIGYEIAGGRQGRGYATAAVRAMVAEAFADESVRSVIAHTLPERNASNRVLERAGFRFEGEADENGEPVWRFRLERGAG